jgi:hypothetical protein
MEIEKRLSELGLTLPAPMRTPPGVTLSFPWVRVHGDRAYVSGHGPLQADAWLRVFGMVNTARGFVRTPAVINGFSDLIVQLWGPERGSHARSAVGQAALPFDIPVEIEAEVALT